MRTISRTTTTRTGRRNILAHCTHAKSEMTPCVLRDGAVCYEMNHADEPICVGCKRPPAAMGLERPADWDKTVASYYAKRRRG